MRKGFIIFLIGIFFLTGIKVSAFNYEEAYAEQEVVDFEFVNNMDPHQPEEYENYAWAPYPQLRLSVNLYFKSVLIPYGFYLICPREYKGNYYILFKQAGLVKFIIPVAKRELLPEGFYEERIPKREKTKWEKFKDGCSSFFSKIFKNARFRPLPPSFIEVDRGDNDFVILSLYYENHKYVIILKLFEEP